MPEETIFLSSGGGSGNEGGKTYLCGIPGCAAPRGDGLGGGYPALAEKVYSAAMEGKPFPVLTAEYPGMTVDESYAVQKAYSKKRLGADRPAGFKAGLTTEATMKRFGSDTPFAAVLFPEAGWTGRRAPWK